MELSIIKAIQTISNDFWDVFFQVVTMFGEEVIILFILLTVYYVFDKKMGEYLAFTIFCSLLVNTAIKDILQLPRPIGEPGVRSLRTETAGGYSFPSGHTQTFGAVAYFFAYQRNTKVGYLLATLVVGLVGLSRLYLGVHYPKDVVVGLLLGLGIAWVICTSLYYLQKPMYLYLLAAVVFLPGLLFNQGHTYYQLYGFLTGFILAVYLENRFVQFDNKGSLPKRIFRLLVGLGVVVGVLWLGQSLPEGLLFSFLEYFALSLILIFLYPWIFTKLKF